MKSERKSRQNKKTINRLNNSLNSDEEIIHELDYGSEEITQNTAKIDKKVKNIKEKLEMWQLEWKALKCLIDALE